MWTSSPEALPPNFQVSIKLVKSTLSQGTVQGQDVYNLPLAIDASSTKHPAYCVLDKVGDFVDALVLLGTYDVPTIE
jgi:hypothetical protein